ncbi:MAG TPA: YkgJ family cysteine cluster protein [Myxococcota bacterium]|nr:YkgJ family cysteine cluster protein [Myxococcota bacterium]HNZ04636.1 YkgJ family cysteine cluster protein [Myxococcota bacterium]HOD08600.1 YkgJ family cysteine cluster protein [Myxococcota bacterium]
MEEVNPCIGCGACCACYRVSFYWGEIDEVLPGSFPSRLVEKLNDFRAVIKGTNQPKPRCVALAGKIGEDAFCSIHSVRSSACREFDASFSNGVRNERCDQARARFGLRPLEPSDWRPNDVPHAA